MGFLLICSLLFYIITFIQSLFKRIAKGGRILLSGKFKIITSMLIFGTIGVFVKKINLASIEIAFLRATIGSLFLLFASFFLRRRLSMRAIKNNLILLLISGAAIGVNWILLFESYKYTTVSNATLSYYLAPVFVVILSPLILKENLNSAKILSIISAMIGLFLVVNGGGNKNTGDYNHILGIAYGLSAAVFYAGVILMNKFIKNLSGYETTLIQLIAGAFILLPYVLFKEHIGFLSINKISIIYILILGIIHTGIAYFLYFTSMKDLKGQTIAILSYIDPIFAVIISALFLGEKMNLLQIIGGALIICSTLLSENFTKDVQNKTT